MCFKSTRHPRYCVTMYDKYRCLLADGGLEEADTAAKGTKTVHRGKASSDMRWIVVVNLLLLEGSEMTQVITGLKYVIGLGVEGS